MFKVLILQTQNNLSDERTEFYLRDRLTWMRFLGLGLGDPVEKQRGAPRTASSGPQRLVARLHGEHDDCCETGIWGIPAGTRFTTTSAPACFGPQPGLRPSPRCGRRRNSREPTPGRRRCDRRSV
jgi:hypothetical protein